MTTAPRIKIDGRTYSLASLEEVSLRDMLVFANEAADMGLPIGWGEVMAATVRFEEGIRALGDDPNPVGVFMLPDFALATAGLVWATRRAAGDVVTFSEACDISPTKVEILDSPQDHQPKKTASGPTKGRKSGKASGQGAGSRPGTAAPASDSPATSTSEAKSTSA